MSTVNNDIHGLSLADRLVDAEIHRWLDAHLGILAAQTTEGSEAWQIIRQARHLNLSEYPAQLTPKILDALRRAGLMVTPSSEAGGDRG